MKKSDYSSITHKHIKAANNQQFKFKKNMINELNDILELGKVSLKWKNAPKDNKSSAGVSSKLSETPTHSYTQESQSESEYIPGIESHTNTFNTSGVVIASNTNPWRCDKENLKPNVESKKSFEKPRTRNHVPQVIDEDTEQFKIKLEHLLNVFKTEATTEFMTMKRSMLEDQKYTIKCETERYVQMYEDKCQELLDTKNTLAAKEKVNEYLCQRVEKMAAMICMLKTNNTARALKTNVMQSMKKARSDRKLKKYKRKLANTLRKQLLTKYVFGQWKQIHLVELNNKKDQRTQQEHRRDLDELVQRFTKDKELTELRLKEAMIGLDEANKMKQGMQENLKRAFMRGVCALNFEAMSVIQGPQPIDGDLTQGMPNNSMLTHPLAASQVVSETESYLQPPPPVPTVQFYNQTRVHNSHYIHQKIETNDHKWKGAPLVGLQQPQPKPSEDQSMITHPKQQFQSATQIQQMSVLNLVQQDDHALDGSVHEDYEGKVIKVSINNETAHAPNQNQKPKQTQQDQRKPVSKTTITKSKGK